MSADPAPWDDVLDDETRALLTRRPERTITGKCPVLVAVDLYDLVYDGGPLPVTELMDHYPASCGEFAWRALPNTIELFRVARAAGVPIIHVTYDTRVETDPRNIHPTNRKRRQPDLSLYKLKDELAPVGDELVVYKKRASGFFGSPLCAFLNEMDADMLFFVGESTSGCLRASVIEGVSYGYPVAVVADRGHTQAHTRAGHRDLRCADERRRLQQVAAGVANIGSSSMVDTVRAIDRGADVKIFINSLAVGTHSLIGAKDVKSIKDLKGKRVMTGGQGDITNLWWKAAAKANGLDPDKDVQLLFSGSTGNRMSALFAGGVEATVISTPQSFKAIEEGWTDLGPVAPYLGEFPMMIWHVNSDWAKANQKTLVSFVKAHNKAVRYLIDPAHKQEVSEMLAKASGASIADSLKTWDICVRIKAFVPDGSVASATVDRVSATLMEAGDIKPPAKPANTFYAGEYVQAATK
jgi:ABC-type nitrate/sulfonate/bicarbonate transport system substrate-binding protein/nicotinamidase-related amidase